MAGCCPSQYKLPLRLGLWGVRLFKAFVDGLPFLQEQVQSFWALHALIHKPRGSNRAGSANACSAMQIHLATLLQSFVNASQNTLHLRHAGYTKVGDGMIDADGTAQGLIRF